MGIYQELRGLQLDALIERFRAPAPDGDQYAFPYYAEVATLIRQCGNTGRDFLYEEMPRTDDEQLRAILFALAEPPKLRRPWLPDLWRSYLTDERPLIVAEAIDSLWRYGDRKAKYRVLQAQHHDSPYVRGGVLRYVSHLTPHCAPLLLVAALKDGHFIVRENALDELDRLEAVDALPYLYPLLSDAAPQVRQAARTAIENLESIAEGGQGQHLRVG